MKAYSGNYNLKVFNDKKGYIEQLKFNQGLYRWLKYKANYEKMLNLMLEHNISGLPEKNFMKNNFDLCRHELKGAVASAIYYIYDKTHGIDREKEQLLVKAYEEKYYKNGDGSISDIINKLIKNGIFARELKPLDEKYIRELKNIVKSYEPYCGIENFEVEKLLDWDSEEKKKKDPFGTDPFRMLFNWKKEPIDENETFKSIKEFFGYINNYRDGKSSNILEHRLLIADNNISTYEEFKALLNQKKLEHKQQIEKEVKEAKILMKEKFKK